MHVCHLSQSVSTQGGGISEAIRALGMAQESAGADVSVMSVRDAGRELAPWPKGAPVWLRAQKLPGMLRLPDLGERLDAADPDIVQVHGLWSWLSVGVPRWAARRKRPAIVSPHGMLDAWALNHSSWKKRIARIAFEGRHLSSAACIHALCPSEAQSIRAYGLKNPIAVVPNGVDLPEIGDRRSEIGDRRKILLFLGRLHPKKGLVNALRAWKQVLHSTSNIQHSTFHEWQFVVAGWDQGGHEAELKRLCDELGLAWADVPAASFLTENCKLNTENSQILFLGSAFGDVKDQLLRQASAFILPSFSEGLPMSVLEAWAYHLPVLMTDHCNLPEGFAMDAAIRIGTDTESIAEGMRHLLGSPASDLRSLGTNGHLLVAQRYTWPQIAGQMKEVYEWVLGGGNRPGCVRQF